MPTSKAQMDADLADFEDEFEQDHTPPPAEDDDAVFGLHEAAAQQAQNQQAAQSTQQGQAAVPAGAAASPNTAQQNEQAQHLAQWEARLRAQQAALEAQQARAPQAGAADQKNGASDGRATSAHADAAVPADGASDSTQAADTDPAQALEADFGAEFVQLLRQFIQQECQRCMQSDVASLRNQVEQVIAELTYERQHNHYKAIAAVHEDFMDVANAPAFTTWRNAQTPDQQAEISRVIEAGTAQEIIDLLTRYKQSLSAPAGAAHPAANPAAGTAPAKQAALDAAEGVRSTRPSRPPKARANSEDYDAAWDEV